jgi:hypothetical protein
VTGSSREVPSWYFSVELKKNARNLSNNSLCRGEIFTRYLNIDTWGTAAWNNPLDFLTKLLYVFLTSFRMPLTEKLFQVMLGYDAVPTGKWVPMCLSLCSFHLILLDLTTPTTFLTTENYEAPHCIISTLRRVFCHLTTCICIQRQVGKHHYKLIFYI